MNENGIWYCFSLGRWHREAFLTFRGASRDGSISLALNCHGYMALTFSLSVTINYKPAEHGEV